MGSFSTGFCVGLGLSLLFAPKKGEEMRRLVGERIRYLQGNQEPNPLATQMGTRLQEVQTRAEPERPMGATAPTASPFQQTAGSTGETQWEMNRAAQQIGVTPPTVSPVRETTSSTEDVRQELNRAAQQASLTTPASGTVQETPSSVVETQKDLNRVMRQPGVGNPPPQRRPGSLTDQ